MHIKTTLGTLQINEQTQISLTLTNPFLTDRGSYSLPFSVPWCKHNLKVLGHPDRVYNSKPAASNINCTITTQHFTESGYLNIINVSQTDGIELSFFLREGMFWKWAKETRLRDIKLPSYPPPISNLIAHWPFNEGAGTIAHDISGNNNHGTILGSPNWVDGVSGKALELDGTQGVSIANFSMPDITTFNLWINGNQHTVDQYFFNLSQFTLRRLPDSDAIRIAYNNGTSTVGISISDAFKDYDGEFFMLTLQLVWATGVLNTYKNGVFHNTITLTTPVKPDTGTLYLGVRSNLTLGLIGIIDEPRIFSKVLLDTEMALLYSKYVKFQLNLRPAHAKATMAVHIDHSWPDVDFAFFPLVDKFIDYDHITDPDRAYSRASAKSMVSTWNLFNRPGDFYRDDMTRGMITPFAYVNAVLTWISSTFGYMIKDNFLSSTEELRSLVILNKAILYRGRGAGGTGSPAFDYTTLLPDCSVHDFISALEDNFFCRFLINPSRRTIDIISFNQTHESSPIPVNANIHISDFPPQKDLSLSISRIPSPYNTVNDNAIDNPDFEYDETNDVLHHDKVYESETTPNYTTHPRKFYLSIPLQAFFYFTWHQIEDNLYHYKAECIHTYNHDRKASLPNPHDIRIKSYIAPMIGVECAQYYFDPNDDPAYFTYTILAPFIHEWGDRFFFKPREGHSAEILSSEAAPSPLVFAFNRGRLLHIDFPTELFGINSYPLPLGSVDVFHFNGNKMSADIALKLNGDNNLYDNFYRYFAEMLKSSPHKLALSNCEIKDILSRKFHDKLSCQGTHLILDSLDISITPFSTTINTIFCKTLKQLHEKIKHVIYDPASLLTANPSQVSHNSAVLGGEVLTDGGTPVTSRGIFLGDRMDPVTWGTKHEMGSGTGVFQDTFTGLEDDTVYYVIAFAINTSGYSYGAQKSFKTNTIP